MRNAMNELGRLDSSEISGSKSVSVLSKCKLVARYQVSNRGTGIEAGI